MSRGEPNEYQPDGRPESEDDLLSQPLDFEDISESSDSNVAPHHEGSSSEELELFSPTEAQADEQPMFEPEANAPTFAAADEPEISAFAPESGDEAAAGSAPESEFAFAPPEEGPSDFSAQFAEQASATTEEGAEEAILETPVDATAAAEPSVEAGIVLEGAPAGLLGLPSAETESDTSAEAESEARLEDEEEGEEEKRPGFFAKLAEASPYTVMLGLSALAIFLACIFLLIELWRYDFDIGAKSGKSLSRAEAGAAAVGIESTNQPFGGIA